MANTYVKDRKTKIDQKIKDLLRGMPVLVGDYIRSIETTSSELTRLNYVYDMRLFLRFLHEEQPDFCEKDPQEYTEIDFGKVTLRQMEMYQSYLSSYVSAESVNSEIPVMISNENVSITRKLASLRSFYKYLYKHGYIINNEAAKLSMPKIYEKPFLYLERDEISKILDAINDGNGFSNRQKAHLEHVRARDLAIFMLLVGSGIRESELVGIDIDDVDFDNNAFLITRKGGNQVILYYNDNVRSALEDWMYQRKQIVPLPGHENALFLSRERARISVRTVQEIIKKYASVSLTLKKKQVSPHRLRASYATALYRTTGDIYQVSKTLGHKNIETVRKYAREADDIYKSAAEEVDWI